MEEAKNLVGTRIERWEVLSLVEMEGIVLKPYVFCRCDCGFKDFVLVKNLNRGRSGQCRNCRGRRRGGYEAHGFTSTQTYAKWRLMKQRILNPNSLSYYKFGGAGITMCERWKDFNNFLKDMGTAPDGFTLDRINKDRGFEPGNCRWILPTD